MSRLLFDGKILVYNKFGRTAEIPNKESKTGTTFETVDEFIKRGGTIRTPKDIVQLRKGGAKSQQAKKPVVSDTNTAKEMAQYLENWGLVK